MSRNELNLEQNCKYCAARGKSDAEHTNCRLMSLICDRWYGSILTRCGLTMTGLLKRASSKGAYPMFEAQNRGPCCYIGGSPRKTGGSRTHRAQIAARSQFEVVITESLWVFFWKKDQRIRMYSIVFVLKKSLQAFGLDWLTQLAFFPSSHSMCLARDAPQLKFN